MLTPHLQASSVNTNETETRSACTQNQAHKMQSNLLNGNGQKEWKNSNVLFCHSSLDDAKIPKGAMRILFHLRRRIGKRTAENQNINPGIESIGKVCRMKTAIVERELRWLESHGLIEIARTKFSNHYKLMVPKTKLYIDYRLDSWGLSVAQMRVLIHESRLCGDRSGLVESFFINSKKFAEVCGIDERTVKGAISYLEEKEFCLPYTDKTNSPYGLMLFDLFPREGSTKGPIRLIQKGQSVFTKGPIEDYPTLKRSNLKESSHQNGDLCSFAFARK
jgi:DNA-binding MarR family transcriptional regulator